MRRFEILVKSTNSWDHSSIRILCYFHQFKIDLTDDEHVSLNSCRTCRPNVGCRPRLCWLWLSWWHGKSTIFFRSIQLSTNHADPSQLHTLPRIKSPSNAHLYRQPPYDVVTGGLIGFQWYPSMENDDQHRDLVLIDLWNILEIYREHPKQIYSGGSISEVQI